MLVRLKSGLRIAIPPILPWESLKGNLLKIRSAGTFYPDHITTRLCLHLLDADLNDGACGSFLDVGCGCGILALAAARLGVPFVVGFDIDIRAVGISVRNAQANGLDYKSHWFVGASDVVAEGFDCVTANLPYGVICGIIEDLARLINSGGSLILSGFQDIDWGPLGRRLADLGLSVKQLLSGDRSFYGIPPSGSFTWMAVLLVSASAEVRSDKEGS